MNINPQHYPNCMSKIGFCFTGEGARGAIQAGIALGLHNQGIDADYTIGISSGACCAGCYAYAGPEALADMWRNVKNIFSIFGINWHCLWGRGLLNQKPAEKIVKNIIKNQPRCESTVGRMNITTGELQFVSNKTTTAQEFGEAVLGAFAISALVEDRNGWVDAGSRHLAPLQRCMDAGCDEIYLIMGRTMELTSFPLPTGLFALTKVSYRALDISLFELMMRDIQSHLHKDNRIPIHIVHPKEELYKSSDFRRCREGVEYGLTEYAILEERSLAKTKTSIAIEKLGISHAII